MYIEIKSELKNLIKESFSGHVKFGIEKGCITHLNITTLKDSNLKNTSKHPDYDLRLKEISSDNYFGTVEYDFTFGKIIAMNYSRTFSGEELKKRLEQLKCNAVKVVVKK